MAFTRSTAALVCTAVVVASALAVSGVSAQQRRGGYSYQTGKELYEHVCQGCHMPDAKGAVGAAAYPALAGDRKLQSPSYAIAVLLRGQKAMPSFTDLSDAQIAEITNYIRMNFGNQFPGTVTPEQVLKLRPQQIQREAQRPG